MAPAKPPRTRSAPRVSVLPTAWITDPESLLSAMASAERAQREAAAARTASGESRLTSFLATPVASDAEPPEWKPPVLRDDERFGSRKPSGTVVIIRRRRAA